MFFLAATLVGWIAGDFVYRKVAAKKIFHAPKIGVFGAFHPQNEEQCQRNPQKAHLQVVAVLAVY